MTILPEVPSIGRPLHWDKKRVVAAVYKLCKKRYVRSKDFPSYLYKQCVKYCGSVRAAKWEARIISQREWDYAEFLKWVEQFAKRRYREDKDWPPAMRVLAKRYCGSIRKAKWEAGVIRDNRKNRRSRYKMGKHMSKKQFLKEFHHFCLLTYQKAARMPGYMRELAVRHCGSVRNAKWEAGILSEIRAKKRR